MHKEQIKRSRLISYLLRHGAKKEKLTIDRQGWVSVGDLINKIYDMRGYALTMDELEFIVENNDKKRFAFNDPKTKIRANQGHSMDVELEFEEKRPPNMLYHGTHVGVMKTIMSSGIKKMARHHVHLSRDMGTAKKVGERNGRPIIFVIDALTMYQDGKRFFISENGVWLTDFVDPKYIVETIQ